MWHITAIKNLLQSVTGITKCDKSLFQVVSGITKCDRSLLHSASGVKKCERLLLQSALGITKCDSYYKGRQKTCKWMNTYSFENTQSTTDFYFLKTS